MRDDAPPVAVDQDGKREELLLDRGSPAPFAYVP